METQRAYGAGISSAAIASIGLACIAAYVALLLVLMDRTSFNVWGGALLAPALIALSIPALRRQAVRESDPWVFRVLVLALVARLAGAVARYFVAFSVYGGGADAKHYDQVGTTLATSIRHLDFTSLHFATGTRAIDIATGFVYALIGPTMAGGFLLFAWLSFWGSYFFYRAFITAVPLGSKRTYAHLILFLPSLVFWPSSIGKEAWMTFAIGMAMFGVAKLLGRWTLRGALALAGGLWIAALVRPHMAAFIAVSFAVAVVCRKSPRDLKELAPLLKGTSIIVAIVLAVAMAAKAGQYLKVNANQGLSATLTSVQSRTAKGGSDFTPTLATSPTGVPIAVVTVLFRPFVFEASNLQARIAALEGSVLLLLCLLRFRWGIAALKSLRRQPYVIFCLVYTILFIIAYSSFANFGLLVRERVQLYPLFLVLISIPPATAIRSAKERIRDQKAPV